jgi:hypothetical protein
MLELTKEQEDYLLEHGIDVKRDDDDVSLEELDDD